MTTAERVAHAVQSLRIDTDTLAALGIAAKRQPLGVALIHSAYSGEDIDTQLATTVALAYCERMARRWSLRGNDRYWQRFAEVVVRHWQHPECPQCTGLKFNRIPGTPMLGDTTCTHCGGTGVARYPKVGGESLAKRPWRDRVNEVIGYLEQQQQQAEDIVRKVLTRQ